MPYYIVSLQGFSKKQKRNLAQIKNSIDENNIPAILPINLEPKHHHPEQISAIIEELSKYFKTIYFCILDQKYSYKLLGVNDLQVTQLDEEIVQEWRNFYEQTFKDIPKTKDLTITEISWTKELENDGFLEYKKLIEELYNNDKSFSNYLEFAASVLNLDFLEYRKELPKFFNIYVGYKKALDICCDDFKEKLTVFLTWKKKYNSDFVFYTIEHDESFKLFNKAASCLTEKGINFSLLNITIIPDTKKLKKLQLQNEKSKKLISNGSQIKIYSKNSHGTLFKKNSSQLPLESSPISASETLTQHDNIGSAILEYIAMNFQLPLEQARIAENFARYYTSALARNLTQTLNYNT